MPDAQPFEAFMQKYQNMVFSTSMRLLANPTEAQDVAQEAFLRAYEHFDELRDSPTAGGWLKRVATNLSLNHLSRYRARWSFFSELFARDHEETAEPDFPADDNVKEALLKTERCTLVERALQELPAAQRVPLV